MALTQKVKDDVYVTVSIELLKMFDILSNLYYKPDQKEKAQLIADIETDIRKGWEHFKLPTSSDDREGNEEGVHGPWTF